MQDDQAMQRQIRPVHLLSKCKFRDRLNKSRSFSRRFDKSRHSVTPGTPDLAASGCRVHRAASYATRSRSIAYTGNWVIRPSSPSAPPA